MDEALQIILQGGALALLSYLIWWTTNTGAPKLFEVLGGIRTALELNNNRMESVEREMSDLKDEIRRVLPTVQLKKE